MGSSSSTNILYYPFNAYYDMLKNHRHQTEILRYLSEGIAIALLIIFNSASCQQSKSEDTLVPLLLDQA